MSSKRVRNLFHKLGRAKSQSTTDLAEWSKSDEKLMRAVEGHDVKKVSSILSKKAMVPSKLGPRGHSIFHVACALGNAQIVDLLLKETDDVNDLTIQGNTCLQLAAAKGHEQVVQRLIQNGAEVDMRDSNDMTALHHACAGVHYGCVHALLQGRADPRCLDKGGKTSLFYAAHRGDIGICKLLVDKGADVNAGDKMLITPLMVAAKEGNREACEFLLKRGANPNTADREGHTAVYYAMAAGHPELKEVFASAPTHASWDLNGADGDSSKVSESRGGGDSSQLEESAASPSQVDAVTTFTQEASPTPLRPADAVQSLASSDAETMSQSEDESPALHRTSNSTGQSVEQASPRSKDTQAYRELESEHEQLSEEYHTLSIENLRLRDKLEFLQQRMNGKHEQGKGSKELSQEAKDQIRNLNNLLEEERERYKELESQVAAKPQDNAEVSKDLDSWHDSDEELFDSDGKKKGKSVDDKQMVALLRSQILTLQQENDQLRSSSQASQSGPRELTSPASQEEVKAAGSDQEDGQGRVSQLEAERDQLKAQLLQVKESSESVKLSNAMGEEELVLKNSQLQTEVETLQASIQTLEAERSALQQTVAQMEADKAAMPSDKVAVLNSAKVMQEVTFDEEGFVEGQDLTKEEFLQAQNDQLKAQCTLLTEELSKLRGTFDAILKAGDNLQADYDQLQAEKDGLHDQMAGLLREKEEVVKENEFLLSDGNALHEDLKKLVIELEKMQDKYRRVCAEKETLQHQHNAVSIAGKVGEVARLLEEREKLQSRLEVAEETAERLNTDQAILLEEVQSQEVKVTALATERDALRAELDDTEALVTQHRALTVDYAQLEVDFSDLLKEKERLEADLQARSDPSGEGSGYAVPSDLLKERDLLLAGRDQLELTIKELSQENATLEEQLDKVRATGGQVHGSGSGVAALEARVQQLHQENAELEEELANQSDHIANLESRLLDRGDESSDSDVEALRISISQLEDTVSQLSRENAALDDELSAMRAELVRSQEALEDRLLLESLGESSKSKSGQAEVQRLAEEKRGLELEVDKLRARLQDGPPVNGELDSPAPAPTNNNKLTQDQEALLQTVAQLQEDNGRLQAQLASGGTGRSVNGTGGGSGPPQAEDFVKLKAQASNLQTRLADLEQLHADTINTYRTHLLSAVQGHMDPEVKEALHSIIEMRSMEQFC